jgi:hypothetical protein
MASTDQAAGLLQKLSLDSQTKTLDISEPIKKASIYQYGSVETGIAANGQIPTYERSITPILPDFIDPSMCYAPNYYPYYYGGGYDATGNDWNSYSRMMSADGVDMNSGVYGDNGSVMYHNGYGYPQYGPYSPATSPVPTMGSDGQLYQLQQYRYPPCLQPLTANSAPYTPIASADQKPLPVETANSNPNVVANGVVVKGSNGYAPPKPTYQSSFHSNNSYRKGEFPGPMSAPAPAYKNPRFGLNSLSSPNPWLDGSAFSDGQQRPVANTTSFSKVNNVPTSRNHDYHPNSQYMGSYNPRPLSSMGTPQGYANRMYPTKTFGQYGNNFRSGMGYGPNVYDSRTYGHGWSSFDPKSRARGRGYAYGTENVDGLNEVYRGPRGKRNLKGLLPVTESVNGQDEKPNGVVATVEEDNDKTSVSPDKDQFNGEGFPADYANAKFFIIKSYSEDDLHKSIKYNIWTSTANGNKKLGAAYQEAQQISGGCPIFLFFSVNTSGQFVGLAEMVGPVDFQKSFEYWQQDNKWTGSFPVKWHIVKDVPNTLLKHITLENNENKPVTNSRDTQEVKLELGLKMIKIFKDHASPTCLLDDIVFYEGREKSLQEKKVKQLQFQKQVWEGKTGDDVANRTQVSSEVPTLSSGDVKIAENGTTGEIANVV